MPQKTRRILIILAAAIIFLAAFFKWGIGLYIDLLWFKSVGYSSVFYKILFTELGVRVAAGILVFIVLLINLMLTRGPLLDAFKAGFQREDGQVINIHDTSWSGVATPRVLNTVFLLGSLVIAFLISAVIQENWITVQKFLNAAPFNTTDPLFNKDIGFYVFKLPFYQLIYQLLMWITILSALATAGIYLFTDSLRGGLNKIFKSVQSRYHLSAIAAFFFIIKAWGYKLDQYELLYSASGAVFGAGYTDENARLLALKILFIISIVTAIVILINIFMRKFKFILYSIGALIAVSIVLGSIYPAVIQNLIVSPNELNKEKPYLEHNIEYTRKAYNLNKIEEKDFPAGKELNQAKIDRNKQVIDNIRLWDPRPIKSTYNQLQGIRPYYEFKNIDIDRYNVDGDYKQVMLSTREMNQDKLSARAKTWINQYLKYTHGFGIAMSPVNKITPEGLPDFYLQDIPPTGKTDLQVGTPQIYFGESTDNYIIVDTKAREFDYPMGNENAYTDYQADTGVPINSFFRKALLGFHLSDYRLFVTSEIENKSQVLMYRNIKERVPRIAPFLKYDGDPYIVLNKDNEKLYWMWDAYTVTDKYPYSEPYNNINYIRNSVKVVVDAYSGEVNFYSVDNEDPLIKSYSNIFPELFKPVEEMPGTLSDHIRYPLDYFKIQAEKYSTYHMQDAEMFYNKEDQWNMPTEQYGGDETEMEPYYILTKLPGEEETEYILILPFTPQNKNNMISWLAARSDDEHYGTLLNYNFPKQEMIYGPMQIEARINQDSEISRQVSLWDQRGSSVIRGNLIIIPVEDSLLYVEPLYLQSEQGKLPELRRVILTHGEEIVMEPTLELALEKLFDVDMDAEVPEQTEDIPGEEITGEPGEVEGEEPAVRTPQELIEEANDLYEQAQQQVQDGDWAGYGETMKELKDVLEQLQE